MSKSGLPIEVIQGIQSVDSAALTVQNLFDLFYNLKALPDHKEPMNTWYWGTTYLEKWGTATLSEVTTKDVKRWKDILKASGKAKASVSKALNIFSSMINWAIEEEYYVGVNPCRGVKREPGNKRDRFITPEEMPRYKDGVSTLSQDNQDIFNMLLYTGARCTNVLEMKWSDIHVEHRIWTINDLDFKNGELFGLPLLPEALAILERRRKWVQGPWVFPGRVPGQPRKDIRSGHRRIKQVSHISDIVIHDSRRTLGSYMACNNVNDPIIMQAMGHKDRRSVQVYARLRVAPVRDALEQIQKDYRG